MKIPVTEKDQYLVVSAITKSGKVGYRSGEYGGMLRDPLPADPSVEMIVLDSPKSINDELGHKCSDSGVPAP